LKTIIHEEKKYVVYDQMFVVCNQKFTREFAAENHTLGKDFWFSEEEAKTAGEERGYIFEKW
jgi:hypothetical protein